MDIASLYHLFLYQPLFNALVVLYEFIPGKDFGIAVIALTLFFRVIFFPLGAKAARAQKQLADVQPKVKEIQERLKDNKDQQARELLELYRKEKVNPFVVLLPLLIQIPILISLYQVFWKGLQQEQLVNLYSFVRNPEHINPLFLGLIDLSGQSLPIAVLAGIFQFLQARQVAPKAQGKGGKQDFAPLLQNSMMYVLPVITVIILTKLPAAVGIYWITTSVFSIWQQWYITQKDKRKAQPVVKAQDKQVSAA